MTATARGTPRTRTQTRPWKWKWNPNGRTDGRRRSGRLAGLRTDLSEPRTEPSEPEPENLRSPRSIRNPNAGPGPEPGRGRVRRPRPRSIAGRGIEGRARVPRAREDADADATRAPKRGASQQRRSAAQGFLPVHRPSSSVHRSSLSAERRRRPDQCSVLAAAVAFLAPLPSRLRACVRACVRVCERRWGCTSSSAPGSASAAGESHLELFPPSLPAISSHLISSHLTSHQRTPHLT